jgi:hypothetical protein
MIESVIITLTIESEAGISTIFPGDEFYFFFIDFRILYEINF